MPDEFKHVEEAIGKSLSDCDELEKLAVKFRSSIGYLYDQLNEAYHRDSEKMAERAAETIMLVRGQLKAEQLKNHELRETIVSMRETEAMHCACSHDGYGSLITECDEHQNNREELERLRVSSTLALNEFAKLKKEYDEVAGVVEKLTETVEDANLLLGSGWKDLSPKNNVGGTLRHLLARRTGDVAILTEVLNKCLTYMERDSMYKEFHKELKEALKETERDMQVPEEILGNAIVQDYLQEMADKEEAQKDVLSLLDTRLKRLKEDRLRKERELDEYNRNLAEKNAMKHAIADYARTILTTDTAKQYKKDDK